MANWFKIYETDLDEKRLKFALSKLPEVGWVWIGILSECCKHSSDTIRWSEDEIDIFGFSDAMKVSIPKVNHAIQLLCEISYIEKKDGKLRVIKWNEKQSEYNHRKQRGDYRRLSDNIGDSPLEERRGEENKGEERESTRAPEFAETPSWKEFWDYCQSPACSLVAEWYARDKFLAAEADRWAKNRNWRAYATRCKSWWESDGRPMSPPVRDRKGKPKESSVHFIV
jgi:hypothetical protein